MNHRYNCFKVIRGVIGLTVFSVGMAGAALPSYDFNDGTLQGWHNRVWDLSANGGAGGWVDLASNIEKMPPEINGGVIQPEGAWNGLFEGNGTELRHNGDGDKHLNTMWARSPEFSITADDWVDVYMIFYGGEAYGIAPTNDSDASVSYTAESYQWKGIALRKVSTGEYVLTRGIPGPSGFSKRVLKIRAHELAPFVSEAETYTWDLINMSRGGWGWVALDDISVTNAVLHTPTEVTWTGAIDNSWLTIDNWLGGMPVSNSILYNASSTANLFQTLEADIEIEGITVNDPANDVIITNNTLTIGTGGIDMSSATRSLTIGSAMVLSGNQEWKITGSGIFTNGHSINNEGRTLTINNSSPVAIRNMSGSGGLIKNGSGSLTALQQGSFTGGTVLNGGDSHIKGGINGFGADWTPLAINNARLIFNGGSIATRQLSLNNAVMGIGRNGNLNFINLVSRGVSTIGVSECRLGDGAGGFFTNIFDVVDGTLTIDANRLVDSNKNRGTNSLAKIGAGTLIVARIADNWDYAYGGATLIGGGVLEVSRLANGGTNTSYIGTSSNAAENLALFNGGTLRYTGAAVSIDRLFSLGLGGGALDASGTGALSFTNTGTMGFIDSGARTLTLKGNNTDANNLSAVIGDNGGATTLMKEGTGTWILSGTNTFTGVTSVTAGMLSLAHTNVLPVTMDVYITSGAKIHLSAGTHIIRKLFIDDELQPMALLGETNRPDALSGPGYFYPVLGKAGTTLMFK
jgi:autotransporter-associated beta strand protein